MALFKFVKNIIKNKPINVFNFGKYKRDFTYISDITNAIDKIIFSKKYIIDLKNKKPHMRYLI